MGDAFAAAEAFLLRQGRLLERRLLAARFRGAPPTGVVDALRGYQNDDGGFGHGLEPDKRCPASLPIDIEVAFKALSMAGTVDRAMVLRACDFLARTADEVGARGAVPLAFPIIESYPRADHWTDWTYQPGLNPTAGLVGWLYRLGIEHPWRELAADYCWAELESGTSLDGAHTLSEALIFLSHVPERERAVELATGLADNLEEVPLLRLDPEALGYGLSPLHLAPEADSPWRALFTTGQIDAHLDRWIRDQEPDGGWPITWEPPGVAAAWEWRGVATLDALVTLTSYGRLDPGPLRVVGTDLPRE